MSVFHPSLIINLGDRSLYFGIDFDPLWCFNTLGFGTYKMTGIVKVMLTIVALVDGDHSLDAHARDIIANAQQVFAPARVEIEKVELSELDEVDLPVSRRNLSAGPAHRGRNSG